MPGLVARLRGALEAACRWRGAYRWAERLTHRPGASIALVQECGVVGKTLGRHDGSRACYADVALLGEAEATLRRIRHTMAPAGARPRPHRSTPTLEERIMRHSITRLVVLVCVLAACGDHPSLVGPAAAPALSESKREVAATARLLVNGLQSAQGSTVGPGGALFVTEPAAGRIVRVDPRTGAVTSFVSGLPTAIAGLGSGAVDVAFLDGTAYVLVTGVAADVGGNDVVGIYRVDGPNRVTPIADIGAWSAAHPPATPFELPTGYQYALDTFRGGFLVTDGHHNRVLQVTRNGEISELIAFNDIVPTGLAVSGNTIYIAEAGPVPHRPQDGKVVAFEPKSPTATEVASGAPLLVDVEFGRGRTLFALSQGVWAGTFPGDPAQPNTGTLVRVNGNGTFTVVASGLSQPTSLEIIGTTAYVVTLGGEVWTVDNIHGPSFGDGPR